MHFVSLCESVASQLHHSALAGAIVTFACGLRRRHANSGPVRSLANAAILPSFAGCWCGVNLGLFCFGLPIAEGVLPSPPCIFAMNILSGAGIADAYGISTLGAEHHRNSRRRYC